MYHSKGVNVSETTYAFVILPVMKSQSSTLKSTPSKRLPFTSVTQALNSILESAIALKASTIHVEPRDHEVAVRFRIAGELRQQTKLPKRKQEALVSHAKLLAGLEVDETLAPQSGEGEFRFKNKLWRLEVSTLPIREGEKVLISLKNSTSQSVTLESLGLWGEAHTKLCQAMLEPRGLVLLSGPAGTDVMATSYALLESLNAGRLNVATIEEVPSRSLKDINQTRVNFKAGTTVTVGLQALLRQDPNVVLVSELYDAQTSELVLQAAQSQCLILARLTSTDAVQALRKLSALSTQPHMVAATTRVVVSQRKIRQLCSVCRIAFKPTTDELKLIKQLCGVKNDDLSTINELEIQAKQAGLGAELTDLSSTKQAVNRLYRASNDGCKSCGGSGYSASYNLFEVLELTTELQQLVARQSDRLLQAVKKSEVVTLQLDCLIKALRGQVSLDDLTLVLA